MPRPTITDSARWRPNPAEVGVATAGLALLVALGFALPSPARSIQPSLPPSQPLAQPPAEPAMPPPPLLDAPSLPPGAGRLRGAAPAVRDRWYLDRAGQAHDPAAEYRPRAESAVPAGSQEAGRTRTHAPGGDIWYR